MPQSNRPRYLTKSRFKMALECPTKLSLTGKKDYGNTKDNDPFLRALAEGGFQVGALAKLYFPGGVEVDSLDYEEAVSKTNELLKQENVVIYEAAVRHLNLFVRVDILVKNGKSISLYEVKAKTFDPDSDRFYQKKKERKLMSEWEPYLYDIAFQTHVARESFIGCTIAPFLYLVNKKVEASVEGLNQNFMIKRSPSGHPKVETKKHLKPDELGQELLIKIPVADEVDFILALKHEDKTFSKWVEHLASCYEKDERIATPIGSQCKECEYRIDPEEVASGKKSGFNECWGRHLGKNLNKPLVLDLWDNRSTDKHIEAKKLLLSDLTKEDISPEPREEGPGISRKERQWIQIERAALNNRDSFLDGEGLSSEIKRWRFPLHFIDFETAQTAIPFNKGRRPYEQIAFQFSHHIVHENGKIEHAGEFINMNRGEFPNFEFVRALKKQLAGDNGTIFRFAAHENTVLCQIYQQLQKSNLPKDEIEELSTWIRSVTKKKDGTTKQVLWEGPRNMVDMRDVVLRYYYQPMTEGSNSLKYVLPATLNCSDFLQEKYSKPIYGAPEGISSRNYRNKQWIQLGPNKSVIDPYKSLEPIFSVEEDRIIQAMYPETEIADGGAAMMAYARMQFTEMDEREASRISQALLRYCELDTFAMVLLYEYWNYEVFGMRKKSVA